MSIDEMAINLSLHKYRLWILLSGVILTLGFKSGLYLIINLKTISDKTSLMLFGYENLLVTAFLGLLT